MSAPPAKLARVEYGVSLLSSWERHQIFKSVYKNSAHLDENDDLFKKNHEQLKLEDTMYTLYLDELIAVEKKSLQKKFNMAVNELLEPPLVIQICNELGISLTLDSINKKLTIEQKIQVASVIDQVLQNKTQNIHQVLQALEINVDHTLIPKNEDGSVIAPSSMNRSAHRRAEAKKQNAIFPYPFGVKNHFPVVLCNPMFGDFLDILNNRTENPVVQECKSFIQNVEIASKIDNCLSKLIMAILDCEGVNGEKAFVVKVIEALGIFFPGVGTKVTPIRGTEHPLGSDSMEMDAVVFVGKEKFPFVVIEAKNNSYSMNAVLQGLQYFGIMQMDYIENDPVFLMTIDKGIMYLYGMARVNRRIVCNCLLSLEFTSYAFDTNDFRRTLYRTFSALAFFHKKISDRLLLKSNDPIHKKYFDLKSVYTLENQPFPAIFNVDGVNISFQNCKKCGTDGKESIKQYFQEGVYMVKTEDGTNAVLKVACNYDIESHRALHSAHPNLVPNVIAAEILYGQYYLVLMEYLDTSIYKSVFSYLKDPKLTINRDLLKQSLQQILNQLKGLQIVHGDFRAGNILAKQSDQDSNVLEGFKLIDFEFTGKVGEPYPFLAMKNVVVKWPDDFISYAPRKFEHDQYMLEQMFI